MWLASLSDQQRESLLGLAHNVVVSDGVLDPNEEKMMASFRREMSLPDSLEVEYLELDGIEIVFDSRCLLYTSPSPRDQRGSRMPSSA